MQDFIEKYKNYLQENGIDKNDSIENRYRFISDEIFDFTTYDNSLDEIFGKKIYEVFKCIIDKKNIEYIKKSNTNYLSYVIVINLLIKQYGDEFLNWGGSIRTAWIENEELKDFAQKICEFIDEIKE